MMNLSRPIYIAFAGSAILTSLLIFLMIIAEKYLGSAINDLTWIILPPATFVLASIVFTFLIANFINSKIKQIYRIISSRQISQPSENSFTEDALLKLTKHTEVWAAEQSSQINLLQKQAEFRKEFLGNLAHELKTPVFSIQGYILTLLEGGLEDERVNRDFLERALTGVDRILNLLEDLDEIARLETDRFEFKFETFDITYLTRKVFEELETKAKKKSITLKFDKHYEPINVVGDRKRITQVLVNLISNSISYGIDGGVTTVILGVLPSKKVLIEVSDNGVGMDEKHFPRLFERFYRVDKSRERNVGGSGLGLAIVKHIIEAHKQDLRVRSTEGIGSTFSFTLDKS